MGQNYFKMWEIYFQEKQLKESHLTLVTQKIEKENKFLDACWVQLSVLTLLVLMQNKRILVMQNEQIKKIIEIDQTNLNLLEIQINKLYQTEQYDDDLVILSSKQKKSQKNINKNNSQAVQSQYQNNQIEFYAIQSTKTKQGFILGGNKGIICFFDFDKHLNHINTLGFQMKNINEEYFLSNIYVSDNDSIITIITQNQLK